MNPWYRLGFGYQSLGKYDDAIASYRAVLAIIPKHFRAHLQLGKICLTEGCWSQALDHLKLAAGISPDYPAVYRYLSEAQLSLGKFELARSLAQQAVQLDPNSAQARYQLGLALVRLGRPKEAASEFAIVNKLRAASQQSFRDSESEALQYEAH